MSADLSRVTSADGTGHRPDRNAALDALRDASQAKEAAGRAMAAADRARGEALAACTAAGLSTRELGRLIGLSHARVIQLIQASRSHSPEQA